MKRVFCHYFWSILASATAFVLSVVPIPEVPEVEDVPLFDKWVHMLMYAGVALAVFIVLTPGAGKAIPAAALSL